MHRTTIMLPDELKRRAARYADQRGISLGAVIRESLEERLARLPPEGSTDWRDDPFFRDDAVWDGDGPTDLSINHDKYLYDEDF